VGLRLKTHISRPVIARFAEVAIRTNKRRNLCLDDATGVSVSPVDLVHREAAALASAVIWISCNVDHNETMATQC